MAHLTGRTIVLSVGLATSLTVGFVAVANSATSAPRAERINVSTAAELAAALESAKPGDTIQLARGNYKGTFFTSTKGTVQKPITLSGPRDAVLSNPGNGCVPDVKASYCG